MNDSMLPLLPLHSDDGTQSGAQTGSPGGQSEIKWKVVARTSGLVPATIIANRLIAEGVMARAWQEGAGQALGLTVGLLGTGYVAVPEQLEAEALSILADDDEWVDFS